MTWLFLKADKRYTLIKRNKSKQLELSGKG